MCNHSSQWTAQRLHDGQWAGEGTTTDRLEALGHAEDILERQELELLEALFGGLLRLEHPHVHTLLAEGAGSGRKQGVGSREQRR